MRDAGGIFFSTQSFSKRMVNWKSKKEAWAISKKLRKNLKREKKTWYPF